MTNLFLHRSPGVRPDGRVVTALRISGPVFRMDLNRARSLAPKLKHALYHEWEFTQATVEPNGTPNSVSPAPVVTWELPILAKYRFSSPLVKPFIGAGPKFRSAGSLNDTSPSKWPGEAATNPPRARRPRARLLHLWPADR